MVSSTSGMSLFIPEIGTRLCLVQDWKFTLYNEYRNLDVWKAIDADDLPAVKALTDRVNALHAEMKPLDEQMRQWPRGDGLGQRTEAQRAIIQKWLALRDEAGVLHRAKFTPYTLPKGTVLRVDRIYIRKGNADYSSLTFFIEETSIPALTPLKKGGGFKKGRRRFWAKLGDVNTMIVQPVAEERGA